MRSRQVGAVLVVLVAALILGLTLRLMSAGSDEETLSGLLPITPDVVDRVLIRTADDKVEIVKFGNTWRMGTYLAWEPKLAQFFSKVSEFDGARLIANNPASHSRMGVAADNAVEVSFFLGGAQQERFQVSSKWSPDVQLCYFRRQNADEVYGVSCQISDLFDANIDGWRDPIVLTMTRGQIESVNFRVEGKEFVIRVSGPAPAVISDDITAPVDPLQLEILYRSLEGMVANGFVPEDEAAELDFDRPDASVRVITRTGAVLPRTRLLFLKRDDGNYNVRNTGRPAIYIVDGRLVDAFLVSADVYVTGPEIPEG